MARRPRLAVSLSPKTVRPAEPLESLPLKGDPLYPTQDQLLSADPLRRWVDAEYLRHDPFAFREKGFGTLVALTSDLLGIDPNGIFCVGSGAVGISINPNKIEEGKLKPFGAGSDLDIALISEVHFEQAWRDLRTAAQPSIEPISATLEKNLVWQKKRFFDGVILANKLLEELTYGPEWKLALTRVEEHVARLLEREADVEIWVYRDYWSLRTYIMNGIVRCREAMA